jgi:hypothetical protein
MRTAEDITCDNCGNNVEVRYDDCAGSFWCMPCREAKTAGDEATFNLRRMFT